MSEVNEGVQIILNRMETNPEEFFGDGQRWNWIFKETMREVMTEQEKAAIHAGMMKVRRLEITAKAAATVLRADEMNERDTLVEAQSVSYGPSGNSATVNALQVPRNRSLKDML